MRQGLSQRHSVRFTLGVVLVASFFATPVLAVPVTWTLSGVTFDDGGMASGSFDFDADKSGYDFAFSDWNIAVSGGNTNWFPPDVYSPVYTRAFMTGRTIYFAPRDCPNCLRELRITLVSGLTNAGGTVSIELGAGSVECWNCTPFRNINAGSLNGVPPTPTPTITPVPTATRTPTATFPCPMVDLGSALPASYTGSTLGAPNQVGFASCTLLSNRAPDFSFGYKAPVSGTYTIDTCGSTFNTVLTVHESCIGPEILNGCGDDTSICFFPLNSSVSVDLTAGQSVFIVVDGKYDFNVGDFALHINGPPLPSCPGDCDGNGMVSIGDVTQCINVFLGQPTSLCPASDANQNGSTSIGEVTQCISRFLNGC